MSDSRRKCVAMCYCSSAALVGRSDGKTRIGNEKSAKSVQGGITYSTNHRGDRDRGLKVYITKTELYRIVQALHTANFSSSRLGPQRQNLEGTDSYGDRWSSIFWLWSNGYIFPARGHCGTAQPPVLHRHRNSLYRPCACLFHSQRFSFPIAPPF